ncbi:class I adenylate-forming enzyme family protein [Nocardia jiangxiensis]|uniref:Class I adenylate-forming enzyme family protein n=1 Tax=Nocardia jiangxiensis TaxID=282685 RepID=A0ABW6SE81_9NOCA|nr:class I adenylate-forming enzyme family protein [Nocardia jiangxiensis]
MNFLNVIERVARRRGDALALRCGDTELDYRALVDIAAAFAGHLVRNGLRPGDRVGFFMHNEPEYLPALLGVWKAGGVAVPLNYMYTASALAHAVQDSGSSWLVTLGSDAERLLEGMDSVAADHVVTVGPDGGAVGVPFGDVIVGDWLGETIPRLDADDAMLMYTSGSTGVPKGVRLTHRNVAAECEAVLDLWNLGPGDHGLVATPLFHVGGLCWATLPLFVAGGSVTLRRWNVARWLDDAEELRPTVATLVPTMMIDIVNHLGVNHRGLDSLRICGIGGSALPEARLHEFTEAVGITPVNAYGQTEQSGLAITQRLDRPRQDGSMGRPLEQIVEWRIIDAMTLAPVAPGDVGELQVRGDAVAAGYWRLPEVEKDRFIDGWFRTGDLVRQGVGGDLYYVERMDDMIISGGENVYPQMVEGHLQECPLIAEVAVIGTPHERFTQQVTAIVVPSRPDVTVADIGDFCSGHADLQGLHRPRRIEIVSEIPRTGSNKVDRPALKARFGAPIPAS